MTADWKSTALTTQLGLDLPIVLGPFGGASSVDLVAAVSKAGGLGSYGAYGLPGDRITAVADEIRTRTKRPFALNIWLPYEGSDTYLPSPEEYEQHLAPLLPLFEQLGVTPPERPDRLFPTFAEQLEAVLEARPAVFSFLYGVPDAATLDRAHGLGIATMGTATTVDEAIALDRAGVQIIVASGAEAAGHRPAFLDQPENSLTSTFTLVPQVRDVVRTPVVAAGGITDGRGIAAALDLGAQGVIIGTALLASQESAISSLHRDALFGPEARHTVLTRAFSGRLARGVRNDFAKRAAAGEISVAPFPLQSWLLGKLKPAAVEQGRSDVISLWAGQATPLLRERTTASATITAMVTEADRILSRG